MFESHQSQNERSKCRRGKCTAKYDIETQKEEKSKELVNDGGFVGSFLISSQQILT